MKKRLISFILCTIMVLSLIPFGVGAAAKKITSAAVTGVTVPSDGVKIPFDSSKLIPGDSTLYSVYYWDFSWKCPEGIIMQDAENPPKFTAGETYTLTLLIVPKDNVEGLDKSSAPTFPVKINGIDAKYNPDCKPSIAQEPGKDVYAYSVSLECPWSSSNYVKIFNVDGFKAPVPGQTGCTLSDLSVPEDAPYTIKSVSWIKYLGEIGNSGISAVEENEKFELGIGYYIKITLQLKQSYSCYYNTSYRLNGSYEYADNTYSRDEGSTVILYSIDFECKYQHIDNIVIEDISKAYVGNTPEYTQSTAKLPSDAPYFIYVNEGYTCLKNGEYMNEGDTFAKGNQYSLFFRIVAKDGWEIDETTTVTFANNTYTATYPLKESSDENYLYWYFKTDTFNPEELTAIDTINAEVKAPVTGEKPSYDVKLTFSPKDADISISEIRWYIYNEKSESNNKWELITDSKYVFEAGKKYSIDIYADTKNDTFLSSKITGTVNGKPSNTEFGNVYNQPSKAYLSAVWETEAKPVCPTKNYTDVPPESNWAHTGIDYCVSRKLMGSTSTAKLTFSPLGTCTRAMIVQILYNLAGSPEVEFTNAFSDVKSNAWYTKAVIWANKNGIVTGYPGGTFKPNNYITREQVVVIFKAFVLYHGDNAIGSADLSGFSDAKQLTWSKSAMEWAVSVGIISGKIIYNKTDGALLCIEPRGQATRQEIATILKAFCTVYGY